MTDPLKEQPETPSIADSGWFWANLFLSFALAVLLLMMPKINARQSELDAEALARRRATSAAATNSSPRLTDPRANAAEGNGVSTDDDSPVNDAAVNDATGNDSTETEVAEQEEEVLPKRRMGWLVALLVLGLLGSWSGLGWSRHAARPTKRKGESEAVGTEIRSDSSSA